MNVLTSYCPASDKVSAKNVHPHVRLVKGNFVAAVAADRQGVYLSILGPEALVLMGQYVAWMESKCEDPHFDGPPDDPLQVSDWMDLVSKEAW